MATYEDCFANEYERPECRYVSDLKLKPPVQIVGHIGCEPDEWDTGCDAWGLRDAEGREDFVCFPGALASAPSSALYRLLGGVRGCAAFDSYWDRQMIHFVELAGRRNSGGVLGVLDGLGRALKSVYEDATATRMARYRIARVWGGWLGVVSYWDGMLEFTVAELWYISDDAALPGAFVKRWEMVDVLRDIGDAK